MIKEKWWLESGEAQADRYKTFEIPPYEARSQLRIGSYVKVIFIYADGGRERMWIEVIGRQDEQYVGTLLSLPACTDERTLKMGEKIFFEPRHVIDIDDPQESA